MEEARVDFLSQIGWDYARLEEMGIISPVINVNCDYKKTTTFSDKIAIKVSVKEFKGVKLFLSYEMKNEDGVIVCTASSTHAFLTKEGKPVRVQKEYPEFYKALTELAE
jgi:acyl-CoA thioester hydrolase